MAEHGHILWGKVFAKARFIFTESDVQHPVEAVFNLPMGCQ